MGKLHFENKHFYAPKMTMENSRNAVQFEA
jgi:hypothetical protein